MFLEKVKEIKSILFKAMGIFIAGILVSMALLVNTDTLAWFSSRVSTGIKVQAASADDIIPVFYAENGGRNPYNLIVKKAEGLKYDPIVYFSVEGDISRYIMHIKPVRLSGQGEIQVPIKIKVNYKDLSSIIANPSISGTITLKYLNEFIVKQCDITLTRGYLLSEYFPFNNGSKNASSKANLDSDFNIDQDITAYISHVIRELAGNVKWENVWESGRAQRLGINDVENKNETSPEQSSTFAITPATMARARMIESVENTMARIQLSKEQQSIIDIIAPGLRDYIDDLYSYLEELISQLNEKISQVNQLNLTVEDLNNNITSLNAALDEMTKKYTALEQENVALAKEKLALEQENSKLKDDVDALEGKINRLENNIDSMMSEIGGLRSENDALKAENESMRKQIEELQSAPPPSSEPPADQQPPSLAPGQGRSPEGRPPVSSPTAENPPASGQDQEGQPPVSPPAEPPVSDQPSEGSQPVSPPPVEPPVSGQPPEDQLPVLPPVEPPASGQPPEGQTLAPPPAENPPIGEQDQEGQPPLPPPDQCQPPEGQQTEQSSTQQAHQDMLTP